MENVGDHTLSRNTDIGVPPMAITVCGMNKAQLNKNKKPRPCCCSGAMGLGNKSLLWCHSPPKSSSYRIASLLCHFIFFMSFWCNFSISLCDVHSLLLQNMRSGSTKGSRKAVCHEPLTPCLLGHGFLIADVFPVLNTGNNEASFMSA